MRLRSVLIPGLVAVVVAVVALVLKPSTPAMSMAGPATVVKGKTASLKISNYAYQPMKLTVKAGTKITVTNKDATAHTVTSRTSGAFDSGTVNPGKSKTFTITKPGVYPFYCQFHAFMSGSITVVK